MNELGNNHMENNTTDVNNIKYVDNIDYVNNINYVDNINYVNNMNNKPNNFNNYNKQTYKWYNSPVFNSIFFNIKNNDYEILIMWFLLVTTIIILLSLVISDIDDRLETERVI